MRGLPTAGARALYPNRAPSRATGGSERDLRAGLACLAAGARAEKGFL